jgi:hypothetical protein
MGIDNSCANGDGDVYCSVESSVGSRLIAVRTLRLLPTNPPALARGMVSAPKTRG